MPSQPPRPDLEELLGQTEWMRKFASVLVADRNDADDLVQETWLSALGSRLLFENGIASVRSWLAKVVRRSLHRRRRSEIARRRREALVARSEAFTDEAAGSEFFDERLQMQRELATCLLELEPPYRVALVLRYQEDLSYQEISAQLGISVEAARKRVSRGLQIVRSRLEQRHGPGHAGWIAALAPFFTPAPLSPTGAPATSLAKCATRAAVVAVPVLAALAVAIFVVTQSSVVPAEPRLVSGAESPGAGKVVASQAAESGTAQPTGLVRTPAVISRLQHADGTAAVGVTVEARTPDCTAFELGPAGGQSLAKTTTGPDGAFVLPDLDGLVDVWVGGAGIACDLFPERMVRTPCSLRTFRPATLVVEVTRPSAAAEPIEYRLVRLWPNEGISRVVAGGEADARGRFRVAELAPGKYAVQLAATGCEDAVDVLTIVEGQELVHTFLMRQGREFSGTVVDAISKQPIADASVVATPSCSASPASAGRLPRSAVVGHRWSRSGTARTDAHGRFSIACGNGPPPSQLSIRAPGYAPQYWRCTEDGDQSVTIAVAAGRRVHGRLVRQPKVPVASATIAAVAVGQMGGGEIGDFVQVTTSADGTFQLDGLRRDLRYRLLLWTRPQQPEVAVVDPSEDALCALGDVDAPAQVEVSGRVVGDGGAPLADVVVLLQGEAGVVKTRSDSAGYYRVPKVVAGDYRVQVAGMDTGSSALPGRENVTMVGRCARVAGVVRDIHGQPVLNALVLLTEERSGAPAGAPITTDHEGRFEFSTASDGPFSLRVAPNSIHLVGGDRLVCATTLRGIGPGYLSHVLLPPAAATTGIVVGADGQAVPNALVFARGKNGALVTYDHADAAGRFLLRLESGSVVDLFAGRPNADRPHAVGVVAGSAGTRVVMHE